MSMTENMVTTIGPKVKPDIKLMIIAILISLNVGFGGGVHYGSSVEQRIGTSVRASYEPVPATPTTTSITVAPTTTTVVAVPK